MAKSVADGNKEIQGGYASNDGLSTESHDFAHRKASNETNYFYSHWIFSHA